jgi:hypothetical protein
MGSNMSDSNETKPTDKQDEKGDGRAHPHQKDKGTVVKTAFDEPMSGGVADIADGDDD